MEEGEHQEQAWRYLTVAYQSQRQGELTSAIALYQRSLSLYPTAEAHTLLGWAYGLLGRYDDAIAECHKAIAIDPEFGNAWNAIGAYYMTRGQLHKAIPYLERAATARRYESRAYPHMNLGRIWERAGVYYQALAAYRRALAEEPEYAAAAQATKRLQRLLWN